MRTRGKTRGAAIHFTERNNVNGVDGDPGAPRRRAGDPYTSRPAYVTLQERYVEKVVDTLNDMENVLFEICNECDAELARVAVPYGSAHPSAGIRSTQTASRGHDRTVAGGRNADLCSRVRQTGCHQRSRTDTAAIPRPLMETKVVDRGHRSRFWDRRGPQVGVEEFPAWPQPDLHGPV